MALARKHSIKQMEKVMKVMKNSDIGTDSNTKIIPNQVYMDNPFVSSKQQKKRAICSIEDFMPIDIPQPSNESKNEHLILTFEDFLNEKTQLEKGTDVQKEHSPTWHKIVKYFEKHDKMPPQKLFYEWIATDHTKEFKDYYDALEIMEKHLKKANENAISILPNENHDLNADDVRCAKFKIRRYLRDNRMVKDDAINNALLGHDDYIKTALKDGESIEDMAKTIFGNIGRTSDVTEITEKKRTDIVDASLESTEEKSAQDIMKDMKTITNFDKFITRKTFNPKERDILTAGKWIEKGKIKGYINRIEGSKIYLEIDGEVKEYKIKDVI